MSDTFVDGCGVLPDIPIGKGTNIRFQFSEDRQEDVSVYVEERVLHVYGMYRPLVVDFVQPNHITINMMKWSRKQTHESQKK